MSELVNPYHAERPVDKRAMLFGRDDALIWVERQLVLSRRFLVVYGPDLIGKTSLVRHLPFVLSGHMHCLHFECKPYQGEPLSRTLAAMAGSLVNQLTDQELVSSHQIDTAVDPATAVKSILQQAARSLDQEQPLEETYGLLLVLDDIHLLSESDDSYSEESFFGFLTTLLAEVPHLRLLATLSELSYDQITHPLLSAAMSLHLGALSSDAAYQLITRPAQGALRFDAGVVKRIADINSNHPYYLQLFCYSLYNRCAHGGWINYTDIDNVLEGLLALPNDRFQAIWNQSYGAERAALVALAGLRGAHGPVTRQEVTNYLRRFDPQVVPQVVWDALESLTDRRVLVRMGALSYRFAVNFFRYWLERHIDPPSAWDQADWDRLSTEVAAPATGPSPEDTEGGRRGWSLGRLSILGLTGTAVIGLLLLALAFTGRLPLEVIAPVPTAIQAELPAEFASPEPTLTPTLVPTPTPTRPIVVARTLPAITYMARGISGDPFTWQVFVMDADGTDRQRRTESGAEDITPTWSPDGRRIAFVSQRDGNREIYLMDADGTDLVNLTQNPGEDWTPAWSPSGQQIAFSSNRQGNWEIFIVNVDGSNLRQVTDDGAGSLSPVWSPDGQTMAFANKGDGDWELYIMPAPDAEGQVNGSRRRLTFSNGNDLSPLFSPQGDRIAFESNRDGNVEIYVMPVSGANTNSAQQRNLSNLPYADDHGPVWSPDGRRLLFYSNREGNWDLFVMTADGENVVNLTNTPDVDEQTPVWRP